MGGLSGQGCSTRHSQGAGDLARTQAESAPLLAARSKIVLQRDLAKDECS